MDITSKLPFVRDRVVESYLWVLGGFSEPRLSSLRIIITKLLFITVIIDDMYDAYGTFEELQLFTDAIERFVKALIILSKSRFYNDHWQCQITYNCILFIY